MSWKSDVNQKLREQTTVDGITETEVTVPFVVEDEAIRFIVSGSKKQELDGGTVYYRIAVREDHDQYSSQIVDEISTTYENAVTDLTNEACDSIEAILQNQGFVPYSR